MTSIATTVAMITIPMIYPSLDRSDKTIHAIIEGVIEGSSCSRRTTSRAPS
jgi:hypothetical protein